MCKDESSEIFQAKATVKNILSATGIEQRKLWASFKASICIENAIIQEQNQHFLKAYLHLIMYLCGDFITASLDRYKEWKTALSVENR